MVFLTKIKGLGMSGRLGYGSEQSLGGTPGTVPAGNPKKKSFKKVFEISYLFNLNFFFVKL